MEITSKHNSQLGKKTAIVVTGFCFAAFFVGVLYVGWASSGMFGVRPQVYVADAMPFYREKVQGLFQIPPEAIIERVEHRQAFIDDHYTLSLKLPADRAARLWVDHLWKANGFFPEGKKSETKYEAYHDRGEHHGFRSIRFDRANELYIIEIDTD